MTSKSNETGKTLRVLIEVKDTTQHEVASNAGMSQPYMNQFVTGKRTPSGEWLNLIAKAMKLSREQRIQLHRAAAKDSGFEIDL